jgi:hypothetical protein
MGNVIGTTLLQDQYIRESDALERLAKIREKARQQELKRQKREKSMNGGVLKRN